MIRPSGVGPGQRNTESTPTSDMIRRLNQSVWWDLARKTKNLLKRHIALKSVRFERDAQWPFKGTYVRQDILHKTNQMEEQSPQSASALYVPLLPFSKEMSSKLHSSRGSAT